ncbi:MAG TPA: hypothetical protein VJU60_03875 [Thermoleophilaceae bacterium]|nr:hypothetical protein [Thermoleophilaceae bacterium]
MSSVIKQAFADRAGGNRPGVGRALAAAAVAGAAAASITYKVLRG